MKNAIRARGWRILFLALLIIAVVIGNLRFAWYQQGCRDCFADDVVIYEDFSDYTEVDTTNKLGEYDTSIVAIDLEREDTSYFYYDFGAGYFDGDFEFIYEFYHSSSDTYGEIGMMTLCNTVGDRYYFDNHSSDPFLTAYLYDNGSSNNTAYLREGDGATQYYDMDNNGFTEGGWTYGKIVRDESVGTYGTLYSYQYSDSARTTLIEEQSLTLHVKTDFQYIVVTSAYGGGSFPTSAIAGTFKNLSLQAMVEEREADIDANATIDTSTDGSEEVTAVDWITPRCAYADEDIGFLVTGDSGADADLVLYDGNGSQIDIKSDSVRTDGYYRWSIEVPSNTSGYIRAFETNSGLYSDWGYCLPEPEADQPINKVQAIDADYPQYFYTWDKYRAVENTIQLIHYKTNIDSDDFADYSFRIWHLGDSGTEVYNEVFSDICDDYYANDPDNDDMCHWRYMLFSFNGADKGLDDKDGLIQDLGLDYAYSTSGFYQALVYEDTVGEYTTTNSAYWYNRLDSEGLMLTSDIGNFIIADTINLTLNVGDYCHMITELGTVELDLYSGLPGSSGTFIYGYDNESLTSNMEVYEEVLPLWVDDYYILLTFSGTSSFEYTQAVIFTTSTSGGTDSASDSWFDLLGKFDDSLGSFGLGGDAGHIFVMILGMLLCFVLFYRSALLRVIVPICVMALAMVFGWVPVWIFVLIALGAGLLIALGMNKIIRGGGGE